MITIKRKLEIKRVAQGRKIIREASETTDATEKPKPTATLGKIPRISRLMALAIRFDHLLKTGTVTNLYELANAGHVSQPRMTQILNMTLLAPDIQEQILLLPRVKKGRPDLNEKAVRPICAVVLWDEQRKMWDKLLRSNCEPLE